MTTDHLILIDSHGLGYQAHYAMGALQHGHQATGCVFGFLSRILDYGILFRTNRFIFCWDSLDSVRRQRYPWYKIKRRTDKTPEESQALNVLLTQLNILRATILPQIGFNNQCGQKGLEADDIMAKICLDTLGNHTIVSGDEDMFQCLGKCVRIYIPKTRKYMTTAKFENTYGVPPSDWVKVKQLAGCTSDCIPGVPGVGNTTALKYLKGELKESTKAYKAIKTNWDTVVKRNRGLVKLPHSHTAPVPIVADKFSKKGFMAVCREYGLLSFMEGAQLARWQQLFKMRCE